MPDPDDNDFPPPMRKGRGRRRKGMKFYEGPPGEMPSRFPMRRRIGRPKCNPQVHFPWEQVSGHVTLVLTPQEVEVLRFLDDEELTQQQTADKMGVSRATVWRLAQSARKKIIRALLTGNIIHVELVPYQEEKEK